MIDSLYRDDVRESIIIFARESRFRVDRAKVYRINRKTDVIVRRVSLERTSGKVRASRFSRDEFSENDGPSYRSVSTILSVRAYLAIFTID